MKVLVTGGAGLVGHEVSRRLLERGARVLCVDDLSLGTRRHVADFEGQAGFEFERWDVSQRDWHRKLQGRRFDLIVHLAANSDISLGQRQPEMELARTFSTSFETLRAAAALQVGDFVFSSTSAVYGAEPVMPTPESTPDMHPVSLYGAAKLASEAMISAWVENYGTRAWVYRFGNVVGEKLTHGVVFDFVAKLRRQPEELEVLGDGRQTKTYIHVEDCAAGILLAYERSRPGKTHAERFQVFNLSTRGTTCVREIAEESVRLLTGGRTKIRYGTSPVGWVGDVPRTSLAIDRITALGWKPRYDSTEAVFRAIRDHDAWTR